MTKTKDPEHQRFPDGSRVRFTAQARKSMTHDRYGLRPPGLGVDRTYTMTNTDDNLHDVILEETSERYGAFWLELAEKPAPVAVVDPLFGTRAEAAAYPGGETASRAPSRA